MRNFKNKTKKSEIREVKRDQVIMSRGPISEIKAIKIQK
jgi:hypothetical protein